MGEPAASLNFPQTLQTILFKAGDGRFQHVENTVKPPGKQIYFLILCGGLVCCISQKREQKKKKGKIFISLSLSENDNNSAKFRKKKNTLGPPTVVKHSGTPYCGKTLSRETVQGFTASLQVSNSVILSSVFQERSLLRTQSNKQS